MENMLIITEEQAKQLITMPRALQISREAYIASAKDELMAAGRIVTPVSGEENCGQWLVARGTKSPVFGAKFASIFPSNTNIGLPSVISQISLYSSQTGEPVAIVGANYLTAVKTGAAAGVATEVMAKKDASKLGIIGCGVQAYTQVLAIQEVRELTELRLYSRRREQAEAFAEKIREAQNRPYHIIVCDSSNECVEGSDIISTCTTSSTPVFDPEALMPGSHLNAVGSYTPFMQEIDEQAVLKTSCIITEHVSGLWEAAGDILIPVDKGILARERVSGSVGDVLIGAIPGRQNDDEITLFESVGSCVLDVAIATEVYNQQRALIASSFLQK